LLWVEKQRRGERLLALSTAVRHDLAKRLVLHVLLPLVAPAALVGLYFTPLTVLRCTTRGLLALSVTLLATLGALVMAIMALRTSRRDAGSSGWWVVSALILLSTAVLLLGPLG
jgi:hypothetical protein